MATRRIDIQGIILPAVSRWFADWEEDGLFTSSSTFTRALREAEANGEDIEVWINSPGGDVDAGNEMLAAFQSFRGYKCVTVGGLAASMAAFFVLQCGARVEVHENTRLMFHSSRAFLDAGPGALRDTADALDKINAPCMARLKALGMDPARVDEGFRDDRALWIDAAEAKALGIAHKIVKGAAAVAASVTNPTQLVALLTQKGTTAMAQPEDTKPASAAGDDTQPTSTEAGAALDGAAPVVPPAPAEPTAEAPDFALASLRAEFDALKADRAEWQARAEKAEGQLAALSADFSAAKAQIENMRAEAAKLMEDLAAEKKARAAIVGGALSPAPDPIRPADLPARLKGLSPAEANALLLKTFNS